MTSDEVEAVEAPKLHHAISSSSATGNGNGNGSGSGEAHEAGEHAHHLKWGEVQMAGFVPEEDTETEAELERHEEDEAREARRERKKGKKVKKDHLRERIDAEARRIHAKRRYLMRRPRPLQYFRGDVLVRENAERGSGRLELFFDLTFVGIIAVLAQQAVAEPTGASFVRYLLTYTAAYMIWHWMREIFDSFYKDDLTQRLLVLFVMACLILFGNNAIFVQENLSDGPGRAVTIASYLIAEAAIYGFWILYSFYIKAYRAQIRAHAAVWIITVGLMIGAIFVDLRAAIALSVVAMALEWYAWMFFYSPIFKRMLKLRYSSALAIEHEIDRYQDFFTIVMGEFVYSLFDGAPAGKGFHIAAGKAIMALMIAFCFQLFYMNGGGSKKITHPLRHSVYRAMGFFSLHLPIVSSLTLCGDALADFVKEERVPSGVRYLACESFAVGTIMLWCLAMLEYERDRPGELWFPKWARLAPRLLIGVVAIFLPLTHQAPGAEEGGEAGGHVASALLSVLAEVGGEAAQAAAEGAGEGAAAEHLVNEAGFSAGADITTDKLLGILTAMAFFTLLWETITALDGPNAPAEQAPDQLIERAKRNNHSVKALSTPTWKGYPSFFEPDVCALDKTHQRDHGGLDHQISHDSVV